MMRLKVPALKQPKKYCCGPTSLRMVLKYYEEDHDETEIQKLAETIPAVGSHTIGIAYASQHLGFQADYYTKSLELGDSAFAKCAEEGMDTNNVKNQFEQLKKKARETGVKIEEKYCPLENILGEMSENCIPIVSIEASLLKGNVFRSEGSRHMVVVVGFSDNAVFVNDPSSPSNLRPIAHEKNEFEKVRLGTDNGGDTIFVHRKK